jgi:predicted nucleic acid-binding Zn ribbon protein
MELFDGNRACAFCNTAINDDGSVCDKCMTIYNIKTSDAFNDGCGCDA